MLNIVGVVVVALRCSMPKLLADGTGDLSFAFSFVSFSFSFVVVVIVVTP